MAKELCNKLREAGAALGRGDVEDVKLPYYYILQHFGGDSSQADKITPAYIRTIINRVPEIKAAGRASVKRDEIDGSTVFIITVNRDPKRRVLTTEDVAAIEQKAIGKLASQLLGFMPNVTHLEGEKLEGALAGISLYQDMIRKLIAEE